MKGRAGKKLIQKSEHTQLEINRHMKSFNEEGKREKYHYSLISFLNEGIDSPSFASLESWFESIALPNLTFFSEIPFMVQEATDQCLYNNRHSFRQKSS